jgi:hypothetical protein
MNFQPYSLGPMQWKSGIVTPIFKELDIKYRKIRVKEVLLAVHPNSSSIPNKKIQTPKHTILYLTAK